MVFHKCIRSYSPSAQPPPRTPRTTAPAPCGARLPDVGARPGLCHPSFSIPHKVFVVVGELDRSPDTPRGETCNREDKPEIVPIEDEKTQEEEDHRH